ncbi:hypothetical protein AVV36_gp103 [Pectobacterium bacteriophage PM2]|uniref:Uncharacterized protein n=1 Tax=Pectobacterium bacteriophage PM2 TaxID=1429794 RepID=A0A0A0Q2E7_9CAUD|nr:hypothetical protein AVV36_gp103 [Pectobacterium bacteriophage PM2]AHY25065.1 hypothetical protein PM2_103 [Pectobacterium bacteriophage PM2]
MIEWIIVMPIVIFIVYFVLSFIISKILIKKGIIETAGDYWFYFILWLPSFVLGLIYSFLILLLTFPKNWANKQINKD